MENWGGKSLIFYTGIVYRGTSADPAEVFKDGFTSLQKSMMLRNMLI